MANFEIESNYYNKIKLVNKCGREGRIKKKLSRLLISSFICTKLEIATLS